MLTVRDYDDGEQFWREVAEPLSVRQVPNNLFVGVANRSRGDRSSGLLRLGVFEGGPIVLGALRTPPLHLNLAHLGEGERATETLAAHLAECRVRLPGVMAEERLAEAFAIAWVEASGQQRQDASGHGRRSNLYQVEQIQHPVNVAGRMRPARASERDLIVQWELGFAEDGDLPAAERARDYVERLVDEGLANDAFALWEVNGAPVATARLRRIVAIGARVSGVYTPPELRGHGFASALTAALSQQVLDGGLWCCLLADGANPMTNRIYQRIGYVKLATFAVILFE